VSVSVSVCLVSVSVYGAAACSVLAGRDNYVTVQVELSAKIAQNLRGLPAFRQLLQTAYPQAKFGLSGAQFTCFTSTKVQVLRCGRCSNPPIRQSILSTQALSLLVVLVQTYKRTDTDAVAPHTTQLARLSS
jgi:hypothetical protein